MKKASPKSVLQKKNKSKNTPKVTYILREYAKQWGAEEGWLLIQLIKLPVSDMLTLFRPIKSISSLAGNRRGGKSEIKKNRIW